MRNILENLPLFLAPPKDIPIDPTRNYLVNLVVDNSAVKGAPAEIELNPTYTRLFGYSERESRMGALVTDYTMVRAGTAHRANGGFLVIPAEQIPRPPWDGLKQMISSERLEWRTPAWLHDHKTFDPTIPFDGKVMYWDRPQVYEILFGMDRLRELFKVKAEFDITMDRNRTILAICLIYVRAVPAGGLLPRPAPGRIIEHSSRIANDQHKLSPGLPGCRHHQRSQLLCCQGSEAWRRHIKWQWMRRYIAPTQIRRSRR